MSFVKHFSYNFRQIFSEENEKYFESKDNLILWSSLKSIEQN